LREREWSIPRIWVSEWVYTFSRHLFFMKALTYLLKTKPSSCIPWEERVRLDRFTPSKWRDPIYRVLTGYRYNCKRLHQRHIIIKFGIKVPSYWTQRRVVRTWTNVSGERIVSIFRVENQTSDKTTVLTHPKYRNLHNYCCEKHMPYKQRKITEWLGNFMTWLNHCPNHNSTRLTFLPENDAKTLLQWRQSLLRCTPKYTKDTYLLYCTSIRCPGVSSGWESWVAGNPFLNKKPKRLIA
jgi:hypothetical protein